MRQETKETIIALLLELFIAIIFFTLGWLVSRKYDFTEETREKLKKNAPALLLNRRDQSKKVTAIFQIRGDKIYFDSLNEVSEKTGVGLVSIWRSNKLDLPIKGYKFIYE